MGIVCMAMIANLQYGWTLFVDPIDAKYHWGRAAIQLAFTLFVVTETWLVPIEAWFVDKYGPSVVIMFGGVMIALAWVLNSYANSLVVLYVAAIIAGIGAGSVYGTCVGNALKWFPDRRGLAAGATAAGFGAGRCDHRGADRQHDRGARLPERVLQLRHRARRDRLHPGVFPAQAVAGDAGEKEAAQPAPDQDRLHAAAGAAKPDLLGDVSGVRDGRRRRPDGGGPDRADCPRLQHRGRTGGSLGFQMAALTFAISLDRIFDGFGRPFFGWVSDTIGREHTMFIAFGTAALMLLTLSVYGHIPIVFVLATAVYFGVFGEIYSLFPATSGDTFGAKFATTNNGMLYTAKGTASLLVPLASLVAARIWLAGRVHHRGRAQRHRRPDGAVRDQADAARLHPRQRSRGRAPGRATSRPPDNFTLR